MNIKDLDPMRAALLLILLAGLIVAIWHISWLHRQVVPRYEIQTGDYGRVYILDRQQRVIYAGRGGFGGEPVVWQTSPLPK